MTTAKSNLLGRAHAEPCEKSTLVLSWTHSLHSLLPARNKPEPTSESEKSGETLPLRSLKTLNPDELLKN